MTPWRSGTTWAPGSVSQRRLAAVDLRAAALGGFTAVGVLAVMGVLLTSGVAGIDIFSQSKLERLATATVATAIGLVFVAFLCGGWVYGALRGRETRSRLGDVGYGGLEIRSPVRARAAHQTKHDHGRRTSMKSTDRWHQLKSSTNRLRKSLAHVVREVANSDLDELSGRIR